MYAKPWSRIQFLVTDVTFEVLCLLMLNEDLFIFKLTVAVPLLESRNFIEICKFAYKTSINLKSNTCESTKIKTYEAN